MDVALADPLVVALILGLAGMPATGALVCKRWREALEYPEAWMGITRHRRICRLHTVCASGNLSLTRRWVCLLRFTDAELVDDGGESLNLAAESGSLELALWLIERFHYARLPIASALWVACKEGRLHVARGLAEEHKIVAAEVFTKEYRTLYSIYKKGHFEAAQWLIDTFTPGPRYHSPALMRHAFYKACISGRLETVKWVTSRHCLHLDEIGIGIIRDATYGAALADHRDVVAWLVAEYSRVPGPLANYFAK